MILRVHRREGGRSAGLLPTVAYGWSRARSPIPGSHHRSDRIHESESKSCAGRPFTPRPALPGEVAKSVVKFVDCNSKSGNRASVRGTCLSAQFSSAWFASPVPMTRSRDF